MSSAGASSQNPFAYVLIPLIGFGVAIAVVTCYRYRRKKARLEARVADPSYGGGDIELGRGPNGVIIVTNGNPATGRRRQGGGRSGRRLGLGVGSREEGLNELGEAPPAYMPNPPKPPSEAGAEHVELMTYSQATGAVGTSRSPPLYGQDPPEGSARGAGSGDVERTSGEARGGGMTGNTTVAGTSRSESPPRYGDVPSSGTSVAAAAAGTNTGTGTGTETTAETGSGVHAGPRTETRIGTGTGTASTTATATQPRSDANGVTGRNEEEGSGDAENTTPASTTTATAPTTTAADTTAAPTATTTTAIADEPAPPPRAVLPPS